MVEILYCPEKFIAGLKASRKAITLLTLWNNMKSPPYSFHWNTHIFSVCLDNGTQAQWDTAERMVQSRSGAYHQNS